jgi:hypothetical protein
MGLIVLYIFRFGASNRLMDVWLLVTSCPSRHVPQAQKFKLCNLLSKHPTIKQYMIM